MRSALFSLALCCAFGSPLGAQEIDGLNADLRNSFYNEKTAFVAKLALPQLRHQPLLQTFYGLFNPASLGHVRESSKNFDREIGEMISGYTSVASGMVAANYTGATVIAIDNSGFKVFAAVPLGMDMDDATYTAAEFALGGVFSATGIPIEITRRQDFVLIHAPNAGLPVAEHGAEVERLVLTALGQPRVASVVAFAVPMTDYVRRAIASSAGATGGFSQAFGQADYFGGYLIGGERPELHIYLHFGSEAAASNAQALSPDPGTSRYQPRSPPPKPRRRPKPPASSSSRSTPGSTTPPCTGAWLPRPRQRCSATRCCSTLTPPTCARSRGRWWTGIIARRGSEVCLDRRNLTLMQPPAII